VSERVPEGSDWSRRLSDDGSRTTGGRTRVHGPPTFYLQVPPVTFWTGGFQKRIPHLLTSLPPYLLASLL